MIKKRMKETDRMDKKPGEGGIEVILNKITN